MEYVAFVLGELNSRVLVYDEAFVLKSFGVIRVAARKPSMIVAAVRRQDLTLILQILLRNAQSHSGVVTYLVLALKMR